jgi:transposase
LRHLQQKSRFTAPPAPRGSQLWRQWDAALGDDHHARIIDAFVDGLDQSSLRESYLGVGSTAHDPSLMLKIVLYETLEGHLSPSQWTRHVRENDPLRWLGQGIRPSRSALYTFRNRLHRSILQMHAQAIRAAMAEGLTAAQSAVQDGSSVRACASRHHLLKEEALAKRLEALVAAVAQDAVDQPITDRPYWMAQTSRGRQKQLERYQTASSELARRVRKNEERPKDKQLARSSVRVSATDPEAPLGRDKEKVFGPMYTTQFVVDSESLLILSFDVFAQVTDAGTLPIMLDRTQDVTGLMVTQISTDAGYVSLLDLQQCQTRGVQLVGPIQENDFTERKRTKKAKPRIGKAQFPWDPQEKTYRCPEGHRLEYKGREQRRRRGDASVVQYRFHCAAEHCRVCPRRTECVSDPAKGRTVKRLEGEELLEAHRRSMNTPEATAIKRLRGSVIERCFGDAKEHRKLRRLHGRGLNNAKVEVGSIVLVQTALTLVRLRTNGANPRKNAG